MKKLFTLILFITLLIEVKSQINLSDSTVQFVGYWIKGDTITYKIVQEEYKINDIDTLQHSTTSCNALITILDSTSTGYKIKWTYTNFQTNNPNKFIQKLSSIAENSSIIFSTDELGVFKEIINVAEVQQYMKTAFDTLRSSFSDIPNINTIINNVQTMFSSKEAIEATAIDEIKLFHFPFGAKFNLNDVYTDEVEIQNPLDGGSMKSTREMSIIDTDTTNSSATLKLVSIANKEDCKRITTNVINQLMKGVDKVPTITESQMPEISIDEIMAVRVHTDSGWLLDLYRIQEVKCGTVSKVKTIEISIN
ncbi:MAG: hypothetical protein PHV20_01230 [Bacteroidales bacterium]|nr:hypothetical protein [Bacteroidales bacterium]